MPIGLKGVSHATRRTVRSNLRAIARAHTCALPRVLVSREKAKAPYTVAEIESYLALVDAQPTESRRMRAIGLICLGAGAGLMGADLRAVRRSDVITRSGGVLVDVAGPKARAVPVLERFHDRLLAAAAYAGDDYLIGGAEPRRQGSGHSALNLR